MSAAPPELVAALAGRYRIEEPLGQGGMATVYRTRDLQLDRVVALKVLRPEYSLAIGPERFLQEIQFTARLQHPHILPVLDSGEAAGRLWYTMPCVEGRSLRQRLEAAAPLPAREVVRTVREIAEALEHAAGQGIIHRDVKPENILLSSGHGLLADFGIAKPSDPSADRALTETGVILGTPAYMSPEQSFGAPDVDVRADEYALAAVAYEMLTGEVPFPGASLATIRRRQLAGPPQPLSRRRPELSSAGDLVFARALAPEPGDRYPHPLGFAEALEAALVTPRRLVAGPIALAALVVAVVGLLIGIGLRYRSGATPSEANAVAIFPFQPATDAAAIWVEMLPDLVASTLEGTPALRVLDPWSLWTRLRPRRGERAESPDPTAADQLASAAGAQWFILGRVTGDAATLQAILRVYHVGSGIPVTTIVASGAIDSLGSIVATAATRIIKALWYSPGDPDLPAPADITTRSPGALKAYLAAKEAMRRGMVDSADAAIAEALRQDSTFGLAAVEAINIKSWVDFLRSRPYQGYLEMIARAERLSRSFSERTRLRVQAMSASILTDGPKGVAALNHLLEIDSTDLGAWQSLTYNQLVYGWQYGAGGREAQASAERAVALDPGFAPALASRTQLANWYGDRDDLLRQEQRLLAADTSQVLIRGYLLALRAVRDVARPDAPWIAQASRAPLPVWSTVLRALRMRYPDAAERLVALTRESQNFAFPPPVLAGPDFMLQLSRGRAEVVEEGLRAAPLRSQTDLKQRFQQVLVIGALAGVVDTAVGGRAARALGARVRPESLVTLPAQAGASTLGWLLAAWHGSLGDTAESRHWQRAILALVPDPENPNELTALHSDVEARLAARRGDLSGALALARKAYGLSPYHTNLGLDQAPEAAIRFLVATLLRAAGQHDSAAALFDSFLPPRTWTALYTPRAFLESAELAEERGNRTQAAEQFASSLVFWDRDQPGTARWRARALAGLARVRGETIPAR